MRKIMMNINCILLFALIMNIGFAQTQPGQPQAQQQDPRPLSDQTMSQRLLKDLNTRNAQSANQPVSWWDSGYGYYGTYTIDDMEYMTRYDRSGNYVETLTKKEWNNSTPIMSAYNQSQYKDQQVTGYWEVSDPSNRKGYYLELGDKGRTSRVWVNDQGKFSTTPSDPAKPRQ